MGKKGDKLTKDAGETAAEVVQILAPLGDVTSKKMFGGYGIFESGKMFGLVDSAGNFFLKADDSNRAQFETAGSEKHGRMPYFAVPESVYRDDDQLHAWAKSSMAIPKK